MEAIMMRLKGQRVSTASCSSTAGVLTALVDIEQGGFWGT